VAAPENEAGPEDANETPKDRDPALKVTTKPVGLNGHRRIVISTAGIAALLAGIPGIIASFKGEPVAEEAYKNVGTVIEKMSRDQQKSYLALAERIIKLEASGGNVASDKTSMGEILGAIHHLPTQFATEIGKMMDKRRAGRVRVRRIRVSSGAAPPIKPCLPGMTMRDGKCKCPKGTYLIGRQCLSKSDLLRRAKKAATKQTLQHAAPAPAVLPQLKQ
jgi:hypothetical protein